MMNRRLLSMVREDSWYSVQMLIRAGADVNTQNAAGETPLHIAASRNAHQTMQVLIDENAKLDVADGWLRTPLSKAIVNQCKESMQLLLDSGCSVNTVDIMGRSPILLAVTGPDIQCLVCLLGHASCTSESLDSQDAAGKTALHHAVAFELTERFDLLMEHGCSVNLCSSNCSSPLFVAANKCKPYFVDQLMKAEAVFKHSSIFTSILETMLAASTTDLVLYLNILDILFAGYAGPSIEMSVVIQALHLFQKQPSRETDMMLRKVLMLVDASADEIRDNLPESDLVHFKTIHRTAVESLLAICIKKIRMEMGRVCPNITWACQQLEIPNFLRRVILLQIIC